MAAVDRNRTIPTGVGKTPIGRNCHVHFPDHPHGRGENERFIFQPPYSCGPSPRAWGKPLLQQILLEIARTIPTGVGKTSPIPEPDHGRTDHPHGRGENASRNSLFSSTPGPSPRAWGKLAGIPTHQVSNRTIPTGVGKTSASSTRSPGSSDHPHGRGENLVFIHPSCAILGPSPRAWGKRFGETIVLMLFRTIPTGVGKTKTQRRQPGISPDHPHGRGENLLEFRSSFCFPGPSPRAWGKLLAY